MNEENRQLVINFVKNNDSSDLMFRGVDKNDFSGLSLESLLKKILHLFYEYASINVENNLLETPSHCRRSAFDIWRHIKYFNPDITIFDVMHLLYKNYNRNSFLRGSYCSDIRRRVFIITDGGDDDFENYMESRVMDLYAYTNLDEFGLAWENWENI